jgi:two-component system KDP operon response regulator KdpE
VVASAIKQTILVAEDDPRMMRLVQRNLELAGYRVLTAGDGEQALQLAEAEPCSLLVLDVMMPILDGLEVCRRVREFSSVPIVIITARNAERDVVLGLDAGADDYLTKPFGAPELLARVRAVLRRSTLGSSPSEVRRATHCCGELEIDFGQHQVTLRGKLVSLTPTEYRILSQLAQYPGRVLTHEELLSKVWGPAYKDETHLLRVNMSRLRDKIEQDRGQPRYILSRPGLGYLLSTE